MFCHCSPNLQDATSSLFLGHIQVRIIISDVSTTPFPLQTCLHINDEEKPKENESIDTQYQVPIDAIS
jgi:hypothetical protein